ncbi:MAG: HAMP domain-containing histidine kinase [Treponema sp.]|jgi:signal transduction histidine kinase|nr:HAMP domain-containing histidine kinase [Treponema sp.]
MISLKNRLILTYAAFVSGALLVLTVIINLSVEAVFEKLARDNIRERSGEIIRTVTEQYSLTSGFDTASLEALGMYFVHDGYIVTVEDPDGEIVWDARSADMLHCTAVLDDIAERMKRKYGLNGTIQNHRYPLGSAMENIGSVRIETYGPFFYSETEFGFLTSINRVLLAAGTSFTLLIAAVSVFLASGISRPILRASEAARRLAGEHSRAPGGKTPVRIRDDYKTRELRELSRSINDLAGELEEGERRQRQLVSDVAHELRTPLACLRGSVEAMIDGVWEPGPERLLGCQEEILRLASLVDDLGLLASLEWERVTLEKTDFDMAKLLESTVRQFLPAARSKNIGIRLDAEPCQVHGDYNRLKQVFINLLSNAVNYTDRGSITVSAGQISGEGKTPGCVVSVADTGIGIPAAALPHIFERFYRSDKSRNRKTGGAGIGLAIAAAIVKAHGGRISAESNVPDAGPPGSVFRVELY